MRVRKCFKILLTLYMYVVFVFSDNQSDDDDDVIEIGDEVVMQSKKRRKDKHSRRERSNDYVPPAGLEQSSHKSRTSYIHFLLVQLCHVYFLLADFTSG